MISNWSRKMRRGTVVFAVLLNGLVLALSGIASAQTASGPSGAAIAPPPGAGGGGEAGPGETTEEFLGSRATWGSAAIAYCQLNPLFGGIAVYVSGSGDARISRFRRAPSGEIEEVRLHFQLLQSDVLEHFDRLIAAESLAAAPADDVSLPMDVGSVTVEIRNAAGESRTIVARTSAPAAYEAFLTGLHSVERLKPVATTVMQPLAAGDSPPDFTWATRVASDLRDVRWAPHVTPEELEELEEKSRERDEIQRQLRRERE